MATQTDTTRPSRRAMIAGLALLPAAVVAGGAIAAPTDSTGFKRKIDAWRAAEARSQHYDKTVYAPMTKAVAAAKASIPHQTTPAFDGMTGKRIVPTTANPGMVATARKVAADKFTGAGEDYYQSMIQLAAAADAREAESQRIWQDLNGPAIIERSDELSEAVTDALDAVMDHPIRSASDLLNKMQILHAEDCYDVRYTCEIAIADLRRITGEA